MFVGLQGFFDHFYEKKSVSEASWDATRDCYWERKLRIFPSNISIRQASFSFMASGYGSPMFLATRLVITIAQPQNIMTTQINITTKQNNSKR